MPNWQVPILLSLAYRKPDRLRIVLISQNFGKLRAAMENASNVCLITSRDLLLSADDIAAYGRQLGAGIDKKQAERIGDYTEGWVAAVSLYLKNIKPSERQSCFSGTSIR
jgi:ATP/maltotriose-dependent transcriptional regulator MalT